LLFIHAVSLIFKSLFRGVKWDFSGLLMSAGVFYRLSISVW